MARFKRGAKSDAIREELKKNPEAAPKEIVATLKAKKIKVSSQMVSTLRSKQNGPAKKRRKKRGAAGGEMVAVETLVKAKKLAAQLGGVDKFRDAIDALAKLGST